MSLFSRISVWLSRFEAVLPHPNVVLAHCACSDYADPQHFFLILLLRNNFFFTTILHHSPSSDTAALLSRVINSDC